MVREGMENFVSIRGQWRRHNPSSDAGFAQQVCTVGAVSHFDISLRRLHNINSDFRDDMALEESIVYPRRRRARRCSPPGVYFSVLRNYSCDASRHFGCASAGYPASWRGAVLKVSRSQCAFMSDSCGLAAKYAQ